MAQTELKTDNHVGGEGTKAISEGLQVNKTLKGLFLGSVQAKNKREMTKKMNE